MVMPVRAEVTATNVEAKGGIEEATATNHKDDGTAGSEAGMMRTHWVKQEGSGEDGSASGPISHVGSSKPGRIKG